MTVESILINQTSAQDVNVSGLFEKAQGSLRKSQEKKEMIFIAIE